MEEHSHLLVEHPLLKKGYVVKGSVTSSSRADEVLNGIKKEIDSTGKLEFDELDLTNDSGWDVATEGCDYVLHLASPFVIKDTKD